MPLANLSPLASSPRGKGLGLDQLAPKRSCHYHLVNLIREMLPITLNCAGDKSSLSRRASPGSSSPSKIRIKDDLCMGILNWWGLSAFASRETHHCPFAGGKVTIVIQKFSMDLTT